MEYRRICPKFFETAKRQAALHEGLAPQKFDFSRVSNDIGAIVIIIIIIRPIFSTALGFIFVLYTIILFLRDGAIVNWECKTDMCLFINNNVIKKLVSALSKICPKCGKEHFKIRASYCSRSCANSRDQSYKKKTQPSEKEKVCPKCGKTFKTIKRIRFCSNKCAKARIWTKIRKKHQSIKIRLWKQTDEGEDNTFNIRKDAKAPLPVVHPDQPHLNRNQFRADGYIWTVVDGSDPIDGRFIVGEPPIENVPDWEHLKVYVQNF